MIYTGKVVKIVDFGAFVNFLGARDGLVHISELAPQRVGKTTDVVKVGDQVKVKVLGFDDRGKVKLSMKQVDQATGEDIGNRPREERASRRRQRRRTLSSCERMTARAEPLRAGRRVIGHRGAARVGAGEHARRLPHGGGARRATGSSSTCG